MTQTTLALLGLTTTNQTNPLSIAYQQHDAVFRQEDDNVLPDDEKNVHSPSTALAVTLQFRRQPPPPPSSSSPTRGEDLRALGARGFSLNLNPMPFMNLSFGGGEMEEATHIGVGTGAGSDQGCYGGVAGKKEKILFFNNNK